MAISPQSAALVKKIRQELAKNGITPDIQNAAKIQYPHYYSSASKGSTKTASPASPARLQPPASPAAPGSFAKFADSERQKLLQKAEQIKQDPKNAGFLKALQSLDQDAINKAFTAEIQPPTADSRAPAGAQKPWSTTSMFGEPRAQTVQPDLKMARALSPKTPRPYRLNITGPKVQSFQLPAQNFSAATTTAPKAVAEATKKKHK